VTKADITIQGYIVAENISDAPKCALHKVGKKDPDDCPPAGAPPIEIPSFWIADDKTLAPTSRAFASSAGEELRHGRRLRRRSLLPSTSLARR